jgi:hypothetical protein
MQRAAAASPMSPCSFRTKSTMSKIIFVDHLFRQASARVVESHLSKECAIAKRAFVNNSEDNIKIYPELIRSKEKMKSLTNFRKINVEQQLAKFMDDPGEINVKKNEMKIRSLVKDKKLQKCHLNLPTISENSQMIFL